MDQALTGEAVGRLIRLCRMQAEMSAGITPARRDRLLQEWLAAAMTPHKRLRSLCEMTDMIRALNHAAGTHDAREESMSGNVLIRLLERVSGVLEDLGIPYAVTGSIASGIHGEPVTSLDVDIVAQMDADQAAGIAARVGGDLYADADALRQAAESFGMANLISPSLGYKIDLSVLAPEPYHAQIMRRRVRITHPDEGVSFWIVSAEDIILMKLIWRKGTRSSKQWRNALSVVRAQGHRLDWAYLRKWAGELGVTGDLEALMDEAGI